MVDPFEQRLSQKKEKIKNPNGDPFEQRLKQKGVPEEPWYKELARTALQIPQGYLEGTTPGILAGLWQVLAHGEVNDPEELDRIEEVLKREGIPFDREEYQENAGKALEYVPTVANIAREIEDRYGIPLEPKTKIQKALRLGTMSAKATPGGVSQKTVAGVAAPGTSRLLQEAGVPEGVADFAGLGVGAGLGTKTPSINIKQQKESGLTTRQYEKLKEPKEISRSKINQINEKVENEFRDIASDIIEKSPIEETHSALKNDKAFKQQARESFKEVEELAEEIPQRFSTKDIKKKIADEVKSKKSEQITPSEYDKEYNAFMKGFIKETKTKNIIAKDYIKQFRKNNEALSQAYEPGKSFAYNLAKRQALSDYNKIISNTIEEKFPGSEFSNLFKSTNKKWSQIMDAESIDKFIDGMFDGKIKFEKGHNFFEKEGMTLPFKRALGEEGFKNFEQLMKDLMSTEQANKMMQIAKSRGYKDLAQTAMSYVLHPKLGYAKAGYDVTKSGFKKLVEAVLDKPQLSLKWDKGVKAFKKGDFSNAEKEFSSLSKEAEASESARKEGLKKFNKKLQSSK